MSGRNSCGPTGVSTRCARPPHALRPCRVTRRPSLRSESNYGPCGPGWKGASRPSTASRRMRDEQSTGGLGRARSRGAVEAANAGAFGLRRPRATAIPHPHLFQETQRRARQTQTIQMLPSLIRGDPELSTDVRRLAKLACKTTKFARDWRNRRIAHRDGDARPLAASVDRSNPAICGHRKSGHFRRPETGVDFYFRASFERKAVWTLVRQLRGPHLSTWA